jgi:hypothetical protein
MDRHRDDADPDPTIHFDADPDPYLDLRTSITHVVYFKKIEFIFVSAGLNCFIFLVSVIIFNILQEY